MITIIPTFRFFSVVGKYLVPSIDCLKCRCAMIIHNITESGIWRRCTTVIREHGKIIRSHRLNSRNTLIQLIFSNEKVSVVKQKHTQLIYYMYSGYNGDFFAQIMQSLHQRQAQRMSDRSNYNYQKSHLVKNICPLVLNKLGRSIRSMRAGDYP